MADTDAATDETTAVATGSCLCGAVAFRISGGFDAFFLCHCNRCRKASGSAHGANLFSSQARLTWVSGHEAVRTFQVPQTRHRRAFCSICGAAVPNQQLCGSLLVVPAGSLDTPIDLRPDAHIFCASRAEWDHALEDVALLPGPPGSDPP